MQLVILAAGKGKRMNSATNNVPKPMLKIKGKPILEHKLNALPREIKEVIFVVGYCGEHIMNHFKKLYNGRKISYVFQNNLNGTGGALHLVRSLLDDRFMVMMGDDLYHRKDIKKMLKHELAVLGSKVEDLSRFGMLKTNQRGNLVGILEKPKRIKEGLANAGLYMLNKKFFDYDLVPVGNGEFGLPQTLAQMADDYRIKVEEASNWFPIGTQSDLEEAGEVIGKFA